MTDLPLDALRETMLSTGFDRSLAGIELLSAKDGVAQARLTVDDAVRNIAGTLHGGAIATLVDDVGTLAIMSGDRDNRPGVTTDLNVSYMKAAPVGQTVLIEGKAIKIGRLLGFVQVDITREDGVLLAQGRMTKFLGG